MPPQVNAAVVSVAEGASTGGSRDDWDTPGTPPAGSSKWTGSVAAYYRERTDRVASAGGRVDIFTRRTVFVDTVAADAMALDTDDVVTVELGAGQTIMGRAQSIAASRFVGIPARLQTTRIELDPA